MQLESRLNNLPIDCSGPNGSSSQFVESGSNPSGQTRLEAGMVGNAKRGFVPFADLTELRRQSAIAGRLSVLLEPSKQDPRRTNKPVVFYPEEDCT